MNQMKSAVGSSSILPLALCLICPSIGAVAKYLGVVGACAYSIIVVLALFVFWRYVLPALSNVLTTRRSIALAAITCAAMLALFAVVYPYANAGMVGGGTDRDDALNVAVHELLNDRYPYYPRTYLGAPISPLPGALVLAMPFVLLGNSAYQNIFWLMLLLIAFAYYLGRWSQALMLFWLALACAPVLWQEFLTGGDLLANSAIVTLFMLLTLHVFRGPRPQIRQMLLPGLLLGIGLSSRANYLLVLAPLLVLLWKQSGRRVALGYTAYVLLVAAVITVPFYLYDPAGFSPLHTLHKVTQFDSRLPYAGALIGGLSALLALVLSVRVRPGAPAQFWYACALPQLMPIVIGLLLYASAGKLDYTYPGYGLSCLWFALLAAWHQMTRTNVLFARSDALERPFDEPQ